jgi:metal-responsive CopG/Arc/MetJ family transcriptional regulator
MKKILVSLPDGVVKILDTEIIGNIGQTRSDALRTIITSWLSEKGYLAKGGKHEEK